MLTWLRIASALIVVGAISLGSRNLQLIFFVALLVHYVLALVYSRRQIRTAFSNWRSATGMLALIAASIVAYKTNLIPLVVLFGIHHVFNEVYLVYNKQNERSYPGMNDRMRRLALVLNFFIYFAMVRQAPEVSFINGPALFAGLAVSYVAYFACLFAQRRVLPLSRLVECSGLEIMSLLVIGATFFTCVNFTLIVFYHGTLWFFYGFQKLWKHNRFSATRYLGLNLAVFAAIAMITPLGHLPWQLSFDNLVTLFAFSSMFHILTSLGLSEAQPRMITEFFQPVARQSLATFGSPGGMAEPLLASTGGAMVSSSRER